MMNYGGHPFNQQNPQQQNQGVQSQHPLGPQPQRHHAQSPLLGSGALPHHNSFPGGNKSMFRQQPQQNYASSQSPDVRKMTPTPSLPTGYPTGNHFTQFPGQFAAHSSPDLMSRNPDPMALHQRGFNPMAHLRPQPGMGTSPGMHPIVPSPQQTMNRLPHANVHPRDHHSSASPSMASPSMFAMNRQPPSQSQPQSPQQTHQQLQQLQQQQYHQRFGQSQMMEQQKQIQQQQRFEQQRMDHEQQQKVLGQQKLEEQQQQQQQQEKQERLEQQRIEQQKLNQQRMEQQRLEHQQKQHLEQQMLQKIQQPQALNPYQQHSPFPQHTQPPFNASPYQQHQAQSRNPYQQHQAQYTHPPQPFQHYQQGAHPGTSSSQPGIQTMPTASESPAVQAEEHDSATKKKGKPKKVQTQGPQPVQSQPPPHHGQVQSFGQHQVQPQAQSIVNAPVGASTATSTQPNDGQTHLPAVPATGADQLTPTPKRRRGRPRKEEVAARLAAQAAQAAANGEPIRGLSHPGQASFTANMTPTGAVPTSVSKAPQILGPDGTPMKRKRGRPRKADQIAWAAATGQPLPEPKPRKPSSAKPKPRGTGRPRGRPRKVDVAAAAAAAAAAAGDQTHADTSSQLAEGTNAAAGLKRTTSSMEEDSRKRPCLTSPPMHQNQALPGQSIQSQAMSVQGMAGQSLSQQPNHHMFSQSQQSSQPMQQHQSSQHLGQPHVQHMHQQQPSQISPRPGHMPHGQSLPQAGQQLPMSHMRMQSPGTRALPHPPYLKSPISQQMQHPMQSESPHGISVQQQQQQRRAPIAQQTPAPPPPAPQHEHQHTFQVNMRPQPT